MQRQLAAMSMANQAPPQQQWYQPPPPPQAAYFTPGPAAVPAPQPGTFYQQQPNKKRKSPRDGAQGQPWTQQQPGPGFGAAPHMAAGQPRQPKGDSGVPFSNTQKTHLNLFYCYSCGYDVDHDGVHCPCPKVGHIPNVPRDNAHECPGASMKAQHKTLPDGSGAGKGWLLAQAANKGFFTMAQQGRQPWAALYNQKQPTGGNQRRSGGG